MSFPHRSSFATAAALGALAALPSLQACGGSSSDSPATPAGADAGVDAAPQEQRPQPDPRPKTWCTMHGPHDFCADFDVEDSPLLGWDHATRGDDKKFKDDDGVVASDRSPPYAFHEKGAAIARAPDEDPAGLFVGMFVVKKLGPAKTNRASLAFDLRVDQNDTILGVFELDGRSKDQRDSLFHVRFDVTTEASFLSAALGVETEKLPPPPSGRWVHVDVVLDDQGTGNGTATLSYDGALAGTTPFTGSLAEAAATSLYLGVSRTAPSGAYEISYDNVTLDMR